jgi:tetratricopeptide (TPR) repeat protein
MAKAAKAARKPFVYEETPLERAQSVFYEACDARTVKGRLALARKALAISSLCADAYVMLAEHAEIGSDEALDLWRRGVDAGKEALGADFEEFQGEFWGWMETRPYMRARFGLAWALWKRGAREEAIDHLHAMLKLNPNDNQGVRYVLADWLVDSERNAELAELLKQYCDDDMAAWSWTTALAAFRGDGDSATSRKALAKAVKSNKHVAAFLLGEQPLPKTLPPFISPGQKDEAVHYAAGGRPGWLATSGALDWLRHGLAARKPARRSPVRKPKKN